MSRLEKPRNIAQKRRDREHEFDGLAAIRRANRDPIATDLHGPICSSVNDHS